ncbi:hypothetical protein ACFWP5_06570 [Streptomyces sp. NPDC058469]|uniref:hypothetical protein n=1 Tax=Streptomyces sp. NPDC058469 TaxID=3346514 RepID=UPI003658FE7C
MASRFSNPDRKGCLSRLLATQNEPNCLTPRQKADGCVLACMSCPLSKVTLDITDP